MWRILQSEIIYHRYKFYFVYLFTLPLTGVFYFLHQSSQTFSLYCTILFATSSIFLITYHLDSFYSNSISLHESLPLRRSSIASFRLILFPAFWIISLIPIIIWMIAKNWGSYSELMLFISFNGIVLTLNGTIFIFIDIKKTDTPNWLKYIYIIFFSVFILYLYLTFIISIITPIELYKRFYTFYQQIHIVSGFFETGLGALLAIFTAVTVNSIDWALYQKRNNY